MLDVIIENIDIWTSAHTTRSAVGRGTRNRYNPYGINKLRELILDLAIQGKLVPQNPHDEPASILLVQLKKEKQQLLEKSKINKQSPLEPINESSLPYNIPESWKWIRLDDIGITNIGLTYSPSDVADTGVPVLRSTNIQNGKLDLNDLVRVNGKIKINAFVENGDLLICARNGSKALVGKTAMISDLEEKMAFGAFMAIFRSRLNPYVELFLKSPAFRRFLEGVSTTTINQITQNNLRSTLIPLPPYLEQSRIVKKVSELMDICDQLEQKKIDNIETHEMLVEGMLGTLSNVANNKEFQKNWTHVSEFFDVIFTTESSVEKLKQIILQLAVAGKLVRQDPKDEPASELLKKIEIEKDKLIKKGVMKKQQSLPEIREREILSSQPSGWICIRLGSVINLISGQHLKPDEYSGVLKSGMLPYLTGPAEFGDKFPLPTRFTKERRSLVNSGDILITCKGSGVGKLNRANQEMAISRQLMGARPIGISSDYLQLVLESLNSSIRAKIVGIAIPGISREDITESIFCLPPLSEQERIILKLEELMTHCDSLKNAIVKTHAIQINFANAVSSALLKDLS